MAKKTTATLRFIEHIIDDNGNPVAHPTKEGQWAKNGGMVPIVGEDKQVRCALPGDVFEVTPEVARDLMDARPGVLVLESEYQKRAVRVESRKADDDVRRLALAVSMTKDKTQRAAMIRMAAEVDRHRKDALKAQLASLEEKPADPAVNLAAQLEAMERRLRAESEARDKKAHEYIALLEEKLAKATAASASAGADEKTKTEGESKPKRGTGA